MDKAYQIKGCSFVLTRAHSPSTVARVTRSPIAGTGIINQSANTQTVNVPIALSASQTWSADSGNLMITGATVLNNAYTLTVDGAFNTTISGAIGSGAGAS